MRLSPKWNLFAWPKPSENFKRHMGSESVFCTIAAGLVLGRDLAMWGRWEESGVGQGVVWCWNASVHHGTEDGCGVFLRRRRGGRVGVCSIMILQASAVTAEVMVSG